MKYIFQVFLLVCVLVTSAHATTIKGPGSESCKTWTNEKKENGVAMQHNHMWLLGYVSGLNTSGVLKKDVLKNVNAYSLFTWMDNYCKKNPLDTIIDASIALVQELHK